MIVHRDDTDRLTVLYGQRRTLAAVEVGRESIPVHVVATPEEADRIIDQMAENDHRAALATTERLAAFEQLTSLGLSAAQIAKRTATKRAEVDTALTVMGSEMAKRSTARWDFLTLDQAAAIAEFDDDPETVKALVAAAQTGQFEHVAQRARDKRDEAAQVAAAVSELTEAGVTVVEPMRWDDATAHQLDYLRDADGQPITTESHAQCPGHAAYLTLEEDWIEDEDGTGGVREGSGRHVRVHRVQGQRPRGPVRQQRAIRQNPGRGDERGRAGGSQG